MQNFDLLIIGGGPAGYVGAIRAAQMGLKVALAEKENAMGGTCLRVGCIPSKALLESSHHYEMATGRALKAHGVQIEGTVTLDLKTMLARKDRVVNTLTMGIAGLLKKNKVTVFKGVASFQSDQTVRVGDESVFAKKVIIATGSQPASLPGIDFDVVDSSTDALSYDSVPDHLVVIGAGVIGLELGSVWRRLGAKVTVVEYLPRILPGADSEVATTAQKAFEKQGIKFQLGSKVEDVEKTSDGYVVKIEGQDSISADRVLMAVGRKPNTDGLGLEVAGIKLNSRGQIEVNSKFETSCVGVYAVGDVIPGPMLAHKAEEEAVACVEGIVTGHGHIDYNIIPGVVYTHPEIASVGQTEDQLKEKGIAYKAGKFPFMANGRARAIAQPDGFVKVLADQETDRILGVHIIGPIAGDLISEAVTAMACGASSEDVARICHAHPSLSEAVKEAALSAMGRALHI